MLSLTPEPGESQSGFVQRLVAELSSRDASVLMMFVFGDVGAEREFRDELVRYGRAFDWPLLWVEGASGRGRAIAGVQAFVVRGPALLERVRADGRVVGTVFHDGGARHCLLAGLAPANLQAQPGEQTRQVLEQAERIFQEAGFTYGDVARTWFYNDELLTWYNAFNQARTAFYSRQRFSCGSLPASTCVRGKNPQGAALAFAAWATLPCSTGAVVREVASPLQCPAPAYGSAFSRATEICSGGRKRLLISGTASIEPGGRTVWPGDTRKQIGLTMEVVEAILRSRDLGWGDVTRATAYFKHAADMGHLETVCTERGLKPFPVVPVWCDICRDDLLFEIELDACRSGA